MILYWQNRKKNISCFLLLFIFLASGFFLLAQQQAKTEQNEETTKAEDLLENATRTRNTSDKLRASLLTESDAKILQLDIPAPRGQITDRNGIALAKNKLVNYLGINLPINNFISSDVAETQVVNYAQDTVRFINTTIGTDYRLDNDEVLEHYRNRKWLPFIFTDQLNEEQVKKITPHLNASIIGKDGEHLEIGRQNP